MGIFMGDGRKVVSRTNCISPNYGNQWVYAPAWHKCEKQQQVSRTISFFVERETRFTNMWFNGFCLCTNDVLAIYIKEKEFQVYL